MSDRPAAEKPSPAERLASIDGRQQRLLEELDRLNERIEAAIAQWSSGEAAA